MKFSSFNLCNAEKQQPAITVPFFTFFSYRTSSILLRKHIVLIKDSPNVMIVIWVGRYDVLKPFHAGQLWQRAMTVPLLLLQNFTTKTNHEMSVNDLHFCCSDFRFNCVHRLVTKMSKDLKLTAISSYQLFSRLWEKNMNRLVKMKKFNLLYILTLL